ncbi:FAD binding domain-containing protein [Hypoxylon sp. NC1633]|nr:FAD binding domain-containing protein [Hypoxylon sp. NC1633]
MAPQKVIIVGGSVAGLLQGLQLKRQGSYVIVLEQDKSEYRASHGSGVSIGKTVVSILDKYDATGRPVAIPAAYMSAAWRRRRRVANMTWQHNMSNWSTLYLILRANFDGLKSACVPNPPAPKPTDGMVEYRSGKRVNGVSYDRDKGMVTVQYVDVTTGEVGNVSAEMVIAADGVHSAVRQLLQTPTRREYSGYIGWRGTVPERLLSQDTIDYFSNRLNFSLLGGHYFISYYIPTEGGHTEPGKRLVNWVWYYVVPDGSADMKAIFTDVNGKTHPSTVPQGLVNPDVWNAQLARWQPSMTAPLAELVSSTSKPFVTKVIEAQTTTASFYDDHLVLVGDAFTGFRSHLGWASEQAARHAVSLDKVWRGEITMKQRDKEAVLYAQRFILLNRMMGFVGLGWMPSFIRSALAYAWVMIRHYITILF